MTRTAAAPVVAAYISGHGYGHYTRSLAVFDELLRRRPGLAIHARTSAQALRLARKATIFSSVTEVDGGPGVAQRGPLTVDVLATRAALAGHVASWDALVAAEAAWLVGAGATLVYGDVPPLAFAAAARAGVPSVGMSNFSWSWIYAGYAAHDPWFGAAAAHLARAERCAGRFLALEMGGGLEVFPRRTPIAPVARRPVRDAKAVRAALLGPGANDDRRPLVVVSFGGFGDDIDLGAAAAANPDLGLVIVGAPAVGAVAAPGVRYVEPSPAGAPDVAPDLAPGLAAGLVHHLAHHEIVAAVDCVIGKPGYGTVVECLHRPTAFVHVPRGEFREYAHLVAAIERYLPSAPLSPEDLYAGRWTQAVLEAMSRRPPESAPRVDGVTQAADAIEAMLDDNSPTAAPLE